MNQVKTHVLHNLMKYVVAVFFVLGFLFPHEILYLVALILVIDAIFLLRNELVFRIRRHRIDVLYHRMLKHREGILQQIAELKELTYDQMLWDLTKWTYASFYHEKDAL